MKYSIALKEELMSRRRAMGSEKKPLSTRNVGLLCGLSYTLISQLSNGWYGEDDSLVKLARGLHLDDYHFFDVIGLPKPHGQTMGPGVDEKERELLTNYNRISPTMRPVVSSLIAYLAGCRD